MRSLEKLINFIDDTIKTGVVSRTEHKIALNFTSRCSMVGLAKLRLILHFESGDFLYSNFILVGDLAYFIKLNSHVDFR